MTEIKFNHRFGARYDVVKEYEHIGELWYYAGGTAECVLEGVEETRKIETSVTLADAKKEWKRFYKQSLAY